MAGPVRRPVGWRTVPRRGHRSRFCGRDDDRPDDARRLDRLRPEPELVEAAIARLAQAPRALEQGRANLDPKLAHPLILERGRDAARGAARYVRDLLPREAGTDRDRSRLAAAGAEAARALDDWAAHLDELAHGATGTWQLGEGRYPRLLRGRGALPY